MANSTALSPASPLVSECLKSKMAAQTGSSFASATTYDISEIPTAKTYVFKDGQLNGDKSSITFSQRVPEIQDGGSNRK
jgi:hypothetical protein